MALRRSNKEKGIVLLLVVMVGSILMVVVGQFGHAVLVDRSLAENHLFDLQARFDLAGAESLLGFLATAGGDSPFSIAVPTGQLTLSWASEAGKFNLNNLRNPRFPQAQLQLERLFTMLENQQKLSVLGLCDGIEQLVSGGDRPLMSMGELRRIESVTPEVLVELEPFLTVYTDGRINFQEARDEVLCCLDEGVRPGKGLDQLKKQLGDPRAKVSGQVRNTARRIGRYLTDASGAWRGVALLAGKAANRRVEVAVRREQGQVKTILFNEMDPANAKRND